MNYIVYKTTNLINNKIYVGVHRTNPDIFDGYIGCGVTHKDKKKTRNIGFPAAVRKYGYNNFKRETLFIFEDSEKGMKEAYAKEAEIVNEDFIKSHLTYNLVKGGKFTVYENLKKEIMQYTLSGKFIRYWNSIREAEESLNISNISQNLIGKSKYSGNFQWKYASEDISDIPPVETKEKSIYQFDMCGNLLKCFKSITEASKQFDNSKSARAAISNVINKKVLQAYGYYWNTKPKFDCILKQAVACYDDSGKFIKSYSTLDEAALEIGLKNGNMLYSAIKGTHKHCKNFRWRFFYGNTQNIKPIIDKDIV